MDIPLVFEQTEFSIHVPHVPGELEPPSGAEDKGSWIEDLTKSQTERETCFYGKYTDKRGQGHDEKLIYICKLSYRAGPAGQDKWQAALDHICRSVKLTATCSFIPSQPAHRPPATFSDRRRSVMPLHPTHNHSIDVTPAIASGAGLAVNLAVPPTTPNPQPGVQQRYAQYANIDGVMVWDGPVTLSSLVPEPIIVKDEEARTMSAYFVAQVPLSFANVDMQRPLLALTCHATLRERDGSGFKLPPARGLGIVADPTDTDEVQEIVVNVHGPDGEDVSGQEIVTAEKSQERDLFRGLAGASGLSWSRLNPSSTSNRLSERASRSFRAVKANSPTATTTTVLRKSFRAILPILSVLTVRMRTLPVACLPPTAPKPSITGSTLFSDQTLEGDLAATICIEIEAGQLEGRGESFEVAEVKVVAGRQGIDPTSAGIELSTRPRVRLALPPRPTSAESSESSEQGAGHFPFDIRLHDQHNLIYNVTASSMPNGIPSNGLPLEGGEIGGSWGTRSESVPLKIDVIGRVKQMKGERIEYVNAAFSSTWNTVIELKTADKKNRTSTFRSISTLAAKGRPASTVSIAGRSVSAMNMPMNVRTGPQSGKTQQSSASASLPFHRDLVVTANIISETESGGFGATNSPPDSPIDAARPGNEVKCYEVFYLEITLLNASGRTVRLMISSGQSGRRQGADELKGIKRLISPMTADSVSPSPSPTSIILLEDDVSLPPLLPRSCQATRIQCMALADGTHALPTLQLLDHERDLVADLKFDMFVRVTTD